MAPVLPLVVTLLAQAPARVTLVFGGDVIPHDPVKAAAKVNARYEPAAEDAPARSLNADGWGHVLGPLSPVFRRNDFAVVNLETPITTSKRPTKGDMIFSAPPALLHGLKAAGVNVATFANNHCLDQHPQGIVETREHLAAAGLLTAGAGRDRQEAWTPLRVDKNGISLCVLAFGRFLNGFVNPTPKRAANVPIVQYPHDEWANGITVKELEQKVKALAPTCEALLVTVHWGDEYRTEPRAEDRVLAKRLLEAGALAVIGHHPHVLQPVEPVTRADGSVGLVAFSLGNLVSNQDYDDEAGMKRDGLLLELELTRDAPGRPVHLGRVTPVPIFTENRPGKGNRRNVQARLVDEELDAMQQRMAVLEARNDAQSRAESKALLKRVLLAQQRRARILGVMSPELSPPSVGVANAAH